MLKETKQSTVRAVKNGFVVGARGTGYSDIEEETVYATATEALKDFVRVLLGKPEDYGNPEVALLDAVVDLAPWAISAKQTILKKLSETTGEKEPEVVDKDTDDIPF